MSLKRSINENKVIGVMKAAATTFAGYATKEGDPIGNPHRKKIRIRYKHKKKYPNQYRRMLKSHKAKSIILVKGQDGIIPIISRKGSR